MKYHLRLQSCHRRQLHELLSDSSREQACFLLCRAARGMDETFLLVVDVLALSGSDLSVHRADQLSVSPSAMLRVARAAQKLEAAVCMVHTHPDSSGGVAFSLADDIGNLRTFDFFYRMVPDQPHSCLVWSGDQTYVAGRVYHPNGGWSEIDSVTVVSGENRTRFRDRSSSSTSFDCAVFDRQALLLGSMGQELIGSLKIGVIGCGGIGSVVSQLLAHSGVRHITLVDFDSAEASNLPRLLGATSQDVVKRVHKTVIAERAIKAVVPDATVLRFEVPVETPVLLNVLKGLDAIICGTDDTTSRAYLNQLCHQYYVPILDLGVQFVADPSTAKVVSNVGKVNLMRPGDPCLHCVGHINADVLAEEGLDPEALEQRRKEGYIRGLDVHEPAMMVFNMQIAAVGVQKLLGWFTGLQSIASDVYDRFDFLGMAGRGFVSPTRKRSNHHCLLCGDHSSLGGAGDSEPMLVKARPGRSLFLGDNDVSSFAVEGTAT